MLVFSRQFSKHLQLAADRPDRPGYQIVVKYSKMTRKDLKNIRVLSQSLVFLHESDADIERLSTSIPLLLDRLRQLS